MIFSSTLIIMWLILAAIFIILEFISMGLTTIWFAGGSIVALIAAALGTPWYIQVILFIVVSVVLLVITRPFAEKHLNSKLKDTNLDSLIGKHAIVITDINNLEDTGQIKLNGVEWTARTTDDNDTIEAGNTVKVNKIAGVKAIVSQIK